jgi:hypothetical protein
MRDLMRDKKGFNTGDGVILTGTCMLMSSVVVLGQMFVCCDV